MTSESFAMQVIGDNSVLQFLSTLISANTWKHSEYYLLVKDEYEQKFYTKENF